ncbi:MAG: hypothetical protein JRM78_04225 [Nitrososphaerota archaeon]|jgi:hypothetical protein|nr:hypothetical protein [Nitrososphaerota archaeon]
MKTDISSTFIRARESIAELALMLTVIFTILYVLLFSFVSSALTPSLGMFGPYTGYIIFAIFSFVIFWGFFYLFKKER